MGAGTNQPWRLFQLCDLRSGARIMRSVASGLCSSCSLAVTVLAVTRLAVVRADLELPNVDKDPQVVSAEQEIREWTALQEKKVEAWHTREKAKLGNAQEREMKAFEEQLRRMRCAAMHKALVKKLAIAQESATTLVERRARAKEEAWAVYKTNEIFQKVAEKNNGEESERRLAESKDSVRRDPNDAKNWLKAFEVADPDWQQERREKMRHIMQTDPNWRRKMDNDQGDGGRSWRQHTTHLDEVPQLTVAPPLADDMRDLSLLQTAEHVMEPLLKEADVLAIESLGQQKAKAANPKEVEKIFWDRDKKERDWLKQNEEEHVKWRAGKEKEFLKAVSNEEADQKVMQDKINFEQGCAKKKQRVFKMISDVIIALPLPEEEKVAAEKPLMLDMDEWLKCELCKGGDSGGQK